MNKIASPVVRTAAAVVTLFGTLSQTACSRPEWARHGDPMSACAPGLLHCDPNNDAQNIRTGDTYPAWWLHAGVDQLTGPGQLNRGNTGSEGAYNGGTAANGLLANGLGVWGLLREKPQQTNINVQANQGQQNQQQQTTDQQTAVAAQAASRAGAKSSTAPISVEANPTAIAKPVAIAKPTAISDPTAISNSAAFQPIVPQQKSRGYQPSEYNQ